MLLHEENKIEIGENYWLRADPVYLRIENNHILLGDSHILNISLKEANSLADSINKLLSDDGAALLPLHPNRWYLKCNEIPDLKTFLLSEAAGKNINNLLPQGKNSRSWNSRINEIQMIFYEHPINQAREMRGELPINSLWVWGGGVRPAKIHSTYDSVWGNNLFTRALAEAGGGMHHPLPKDADALLNHSSNVGRQLIVLDDLQKYAQYRDAYSWRNELVNLEKNWFLPLLQALRKKKIRQLKLTAVNENATRDFVVTPGDFWKFWASVHPLSVYS
ncbi:hypothetical protein [Nitrosomonas sp.]|uniref:hypothetical protein n=1 Tax=Nitrosomonas sp. TaxID=42353 RepID=UPI0025CF73D1|nr:hypothetical protein [Nitrosomonas sp.]